jgi:hypothetical protein
VVITRKRHGARKLEVMSTAVLRVIMAASAALLLLLPLWVESCSNKDDSVPQAPGTERVGDVLGAGS